MKSRIAKIISNRGYCSRRDAEKLVLAGSVKVNGELACDVATNFPNDAIVTINDQEIKPFDKTRLWIYHKPLGIITTRKDPQGRKTVFDAFDSPEHLVSVGRLDINSQGLLLVTNDKGLAAHLENPTNNFARTYKVRFFGKIPDKLFDVQKGIEIEGIRYKPIKLKILKQGINSWCEMQLSEGKNREIRKVLQHFDLQVNRLIRTQYGPFKLGDLQEGEIKEINYVKSSCRELKK